MNSVLLASLCSSDATCRRQAYIYFEQLKNSCEGWQTSAEYILNCPCNDESQFFCLQIIEHYVNKKYTKESSNADIQCFIRTLIYKLSNNELKMNNMVLRKFSVIVARVFRIDFRSRWESFFYDILMDKDNPVAIYLYLEILKNIDYEVVSKEINRSENDENLNSDLKDEMRTCVNELVIQWKHILTHYDVEHPNLVITCLEIMGRFISWINLEYLANNDMITIFISLINHRPLIREAVLECIVEIFKKGMKPEEKFQLIVDVMILLNNASIMVLEPPVNGVYDSTLEEHFFVSKQASLCSTITIQLVAVWNKFCMNKMYTEAIHVCHHLDQNSKLLLRYISDVDDDICYSLIEAVRLYVGCLKIRIQAMPSPTNSHAPITQLHLNFLSEAMSTLATKMKYSLDYNFNFNNEDQFEDFETFRNCVKVAVFAIASAKNSIVLEFTKGLFMDLKNQVNESEIPFNTVEIAMFMFYTLAESIPSPSGKQFSSDQAEKTDCLKILMQNMLTSAIPLHPHHTVRLHYFEILSRYDLFFSEIDKGSTYVAQVLQSFLGPMGIQCQDGRVSGRASYLFSRFVKSLPRNILQPFTNDLLITIDSLFCKLPSLNLSSEDLIFIYETSSIILVQSTCDSSRKSLLMKNLLTPIVEGFISDIGLLKSGETEIDNCTKNSPQTPERDNRLQTMNCQVDEILTKITRSISYASRLSKGFTSSTIMSETACTPVFAETLRVFTNQGLSLNCCAMRRSRLFVSIRQYAHRMVICLGDGVLSLLPDVITSQLDHPTNNELCELMPLLLQAICKYKKKCIPFLNDLFMPINKTIYNILSQPFNLEDMNAKGENTSLRRAYYTFLSTIVINDISDVILNQEKADFDKVMTTVLEGTYNTDAIIQKYSFSILTKLINVWGPSDKVPGFQSYIFNQIITCCVVAPLNSTFNLKDAQACIALNEDAKCLMTIYKQFGDKMLTFLLDIFVKQVQMSSEICQELSISITKEPSVFKAYLKQMFNFYKPKFDRNINCDF